ncbi:MAG: DUF4097 family beta strand repeat-containing protein [Candidatus Dependentiae bacterium]|nr:DUF4097 family beta strand repeat-containing protein [Candidatus Dependentiae bacterium]
MKNLYTQSMSLLLLSFTIPIETKISIPKPPKSVSSFFSKTKEEIIHKEFNHIKKIEILCDHEDQCCNVFVESWKQPCVLVELKKQGSDLFLQDADMKCVDRESVLQVTTMVKEDAVSGTMSLRILVPETLPIKVSATVGDIFIKGLSGDIEAKTNSNSISILDGNGTVLANTLDGDIEVKRKSISSSSCLNLQSEQGNITVLVPQELHAQIQAQSPLGKISSDLFITLHPKTMLLNNEEFKKMRQNIHGSIGQSMENKNEPLILLKSDEGSIKINHYDSKKRT